MLQAFLIVSVVDLTTGPPKARPQNRVAAEAAEAERHELEEKAPPGRGRARRAFAARSFADESPKYGSIEHLARSQKADRNPPSPD